MKFDPDTFAAFSAVLFNDNPVPMWVYDTDTLRFLTVNDAAMDAYGYSREEFLAMTVLDIRPPEERQRTKDWIAARDTSRSFLTTGVTEPGAGRNGHSWRHVHADGTVMDVEVANSYRITYAGRPALLGIIFDITEKNGSILRLQTNRAALEEAHEIAHLGTFTFDLQEGTFHLGGVLVRAYGRAEIPLADVANELDRVWHPDDVVEKQRVIESLQRVEPYNGEFRMDVEGEARWFHGRTSIVRSPEGTPAAIVGVAVDITDRKLEAEHLRMLAYTDVATGLPNRASMFEHAATTGTEPAGLVLVRITWDALALQRTQELRVLTAQAITAKLKALAPPDALLFRYSDEKFAIVTRRTERLRVPLPLGKRIIAAFEEPLAVGDGEFVVVPTIGVAAADGAGYDLVELSRRAEAALHEAARSDDRIALYTAGLAEAQDRRIAIECNLRHAIVEQRVAVVYQPIVSLHRGRVVGAEALMRWDCPGIGPVPPDEFISIAEESGAILRLGEWILRTACEQVRTWQRGGLGDLRMAVNVSGRQVQQREFFRFVMEACAGAGLAPSDLELELTESVMMQSDGLAMRNLEALRRAGVRISIDDFGTGYSALSYLAKLPLDAVKLDRAFVAPIAGDPFQAELAESVITLAHRQGLSVVGEGVETAAQLGRLQAMGCDEAQGFLFARPLEADDFADFMRREHVVAAAAPRLVLSA